MTKASESAPQRGSVFWRLYAVAWTLMGVAAIAYLSVALSQPDLLANPKDQSVRAVEMALKQQKRVTRELASLRRNIGSLRDEVDRIKDDVATRVAQARHTTTPEPPPTQPGIPPVVPVDIETKSVVTTTEQPVQVTAEATPRRSGTPPLPIRTPIERRQATNSETPASSIVTATILNAPETGNITTGSVASDSSPQPQAVTRAPVSTNQPAPVPQPAVTPSVAPTIKFGAATIEPAAPTGPTAVIISVAPSVDVLRNEWQRLSIQHPALLGTLQARYDAMAPDGPYRLLAGPLSGREEADRLCSALQTYSEACRVEDSFAGNAL